jgi:UDP-N-acetylglucosamine:LPS N-acetylglucosamine transferase
MQYKSPPQHNLVIFDPSPVDANFTTTLSQNATVFVADATPGLIENLRELGHSVVTPDSIHSAETTTEAHRQTTSVLDAIWDIPSGDTTLSEEMSYGGVPIQVAAHTWLAIPLTNALTALNTLDRWWSDTPPNRVFIPREPGTWAVAARHLALARSIPIHTLADVPARTPLWPPTRAMVSKRLVPKAFREWREARATQADIRRIIRPAATKANTSSTTIFAAIHFIAEAKALGPIFERILSDKQSALCVLADEHGRGADTLGNAAIPFGSLQNVGFSSQNARSVLNAWRSLSAKWHIALARPEATALSHCGVAVIPLMEHILQGFTTFSREQNNLRQYLVWIELMNLALSKMQPRVVLIADDAMAFGAIIAHTARNHDAKVLHVQHGAITDHPKHRKSDVDVVTVGGEAVKRLLVARGTESENVVVTGFPQFDSLADTQRLKAVPVREQLGLPTDKPLVVFTMLSGVGITSRNEVSLALREMVNACERMQHDAAFVFKRHPADQGDILAQLNLDPVQYGAAVTIDTPIHPLLCAADVVVTQMSTTGQEALMLEKPLVIVNLSGGSGTIPYIEYGAAIGVDKPGTLADAISKALYDTGVRENLAAGGGQFVRDFTYRNDGGATDRIIKKIYRLTRTESPLD